MARPSLPPRQVVAAKVALPWSTQSAPRKHCQSRIHEKPGTGKLPSLSWKSVLVQGLGRLPRSWTITAMAVLTRVPRIAYRSLPRMARDLPSDLATRILGQTSTTKVLTKLRLAITWIPVGNLLVLASPPAKCPSLTDRNDQSYLLMRRQVRQSNLYRVQIRSIDRAVLSHTTTITIITTIPLT